MAYSFLTHFNHMLLRLCLASYITLTSTFCIMLWSWRSVFLPMIQMNNDTSFDTNT